MEVLLTREAHKQYSRLPQREQVKVKRKLHTLETFPFSGKNLTGELKGRHSLKVWPYRIIYFISKSPKQIWVVSIIHRQGAYK